jgi:hypothetical protein
MKKINIYLYASTSSSIFFPFVSCNGNQTEINWIDKIKGSVVPQVKYYDEISAEKWTLDTIIKDDKVRAVNGKNNVIYLFFSI